MAERIERRATNARQLLWAIELQKTPPPVGQRGRPVRQLQKAWPPWYTPALWVGLSGFVGDPEASCASAARGQGRRRGVNERRWAGGEPREAGLR